MTYPGWHIDRLRFSGANNREAMLEFSTGLTLIYGASNTGKSFAVKAIDFMMGGGSDLPNIQERNPYNKIWLDLSLLQDRGVTLERAIVGGSFMLHEGPATTRTLSPKHDPVNQANISTFLLSQMEATNKKVAIDASGTHSNLTFRDIARVVLTKEIAIQSENSPIELGDKKDITRERSVLKFMMTGMDDSAITPIVRPKDFKTGRSAKAEILQEMVDRLDGEIATGYPDAIGLADQSDRINETLQRMETELSSTRLSIRALLDEKRQLSAKISATERRAVDIALSLESFDQLGAVYESDIKRLEAIEEAGFLLGRAMNLPCPVCGAPSEAQTHSHGMDEIEKVRSASEFEIQKIKRQHSELLRTIEGTNIESRNLAALITKMREELGEVEVKLERATPNVDEHQRRLSDVIATRDHVQHGLSLLKQRDDLMKQKGNVEASKSPKRTETIQRDLSTETAKALADVVSSVLGEWGFPGERHVFFDLNTYDLIIDGKERRNNGKGVRAITHAAFKVALLLFCRERGLPHPGFLILDSPLLTYRDPMRLPGDILTADEQEIRRTDLKERFFKHLGHIGDKAQFIVFENIDPPDDIKDYASVIAFTNDPTTGRQGLL